jgi:hypothetical protein
MAATLKVIRLTPDVDLPHLLEDAAKSPVLIEQNGVLFRLSREPDVVAAALLDRREPPVPRGENESLVDYFERISDFVMHGRVFTDDSTDLLRQSREERAAELP